MEDFKVGDTVKHINNDFKGIVQYVSTIYTMQEFGEYKIKYKCYYPDFLEGWMEKELRKEVGDILKNKMRNCFLIYGSLTRRKTFFRDEHLKSVKLLLTEKCIKPIDRSTIPGNKTFSDSWDGLNAKSIEIEIT